MIERVEIDVRPELAGQIADRKSTRACRGKEVITCKVCRFNSFVNINTAVQDQFTQAQSLTVVKYAGELAI